MRLEWKKLVLCMGLLGLTSETWAEVNLQNEVSSEQKTTFYQKLKKNIALNYFGLYRGSPLNNLANAHQPTARGEIDPSSPQSIESSLTLGYKVNSEWTVGTLGHFYYFPVGSPVGTGHDIQMFDPMLFVQKDNLIQSKDFTLTGKLFVYLPLTSVDVLQSNRLMTAVSPTVIATYKVPSSDLVLGVFSYLRGYIPESDTRDDALTYKFALAPNLSYAVSKNLAATLWVDLISMARKRGSAFLTGMDFDPVDVQPGLSWDVSSLVNINPVINIYPAHPSLASSSFQVYASAKAF